MSNVLQYGMARWMNLNQCESQAHFVSRRPRAIVYIWRLNEQMNSYLQAESVRSLGLIQLCFTHMSSVFHLPFVSSSYLLLLTRALVSWDLAMLYFMLIDSTWSVRNLCVKRGYQSRESHNASTSHEVGSNNKILVRERRSMSSLQPPTPFTPRTPYATTYVVRAFVFSPRVVKCNFISGQRVVNCKNKKQAKQAESKASTVQVV